MTAKNTELLTLRVDKNRKKAFMDMLKLFDFVTVETTGDAISRYIRSAPRGKKLSEKTIQAEISKLGKRVK